MVHGNDSLVAASVVFQSPGPGVCHNIKHSNLMVICFKIFFRWLHLKSALSHNNTPDKILCHFDPSSRACLTFFPVVTLLMPVMARDINTTNLFIQSSQPPLSNFPTKFLSQDH